MSIDFQALGSAIGEIRKEWGYTQKDVYQLTMVSIETQRRIEHGLKEPKITTLERLSALYKVDLLKLALEKRESVSFFSDEMIRIINRSIWQRDAGANKENIDQYINVLNRYKNQWDDSRQVERQLVDKMISFRHVLKDFNVGGFKYKEQNIYLIEDFLKQMDSSGKRSLQDPYQLNIEITLGLFLVSFFHLTGKIEECIVILNKLERAINKTQISDLRNSDYLVTIKLNRAIVYLTVEDYEMMFKSLKEILEEDLTYMTTIHLYDALVLQGIAMYKLGMDGYNSLIDTSFKHSSEARREFYKEELKNSNIPITLPN